MIGSSAPFSLNPPLSAPERGASKAANQAKPGDWLAKALVGKSVNLMPKEADFWPTSVFKFASTKLTAAPPDKSAKSDLIDRSFPSFVTASRPPSTVQLSKFFAS